MRGMMVRRTAAVDGGAEIKIARGGEEGLRALVRSDRRPNVVRARIRLGWKAVGEGEQSNILRRLNVLDRNAVT